jgi:predicted flap endonuclease-1-like 5' DNA nuclease
MRTDYILYVVAVLFFIITGVVAIYSIEFQQLWIFGTAVLGIFFAGLGYSQRPGTKSITVEVTPSTPQPEPVQPIVAEVVKEEEPPAPVETVTTVAPVLELMQVKGIKAKRAEQLKALGIDSVQDLANASSGKLAEQLKIAPYFTEKWIQSAKELLQKS